MTKIRLLAWSSCLISGVLCIVTSYMIFRHIAKPEILIRLVPIGERIAIQLSNNTSVEVNLDLSDMDYFLYVPNSAIRKYWIQIRSNVNNQLQNKIYNLRKNLIKLRPGESIDLGDISHLLVGLPPGEALVYAVYTEEQNSTHKGSVRQRVAISMPLVVELENQ